MLSIITYIRYPHLFALAFLKKIWWIFSDKHFLQLRYYLEMHKKLHLNNPQTFSEKMQWLKLYNRKAEYTTLVDKYAVKDYVKSIIGEKYIIPTLGVWNDFDEIDFSTLPKQFVLKTTGGGGSTGVIICKDKNKLDKNAARIKLEYSAKHNIYTTLKEYPYKNVQSRILAETLLEIPNNADLYDYKFFCFNGEPEEYCQVISGRDQIMSIDFFDKDWKHQPFHEPKEFPFAETEPAKPIGYELMLNLARQLSKDIPFVRIDFYNINGQIYFGEITFFPTSGFGGFLPDEWDLKLGTLITLPSSLL